MTEHKVPQRRIGMGEGYDVEEDLPCCAQSIYIHEYRHKEGYHDKEHHREHKCGEGLGISGKDAQDECHTQPYAYGNEDLKHHKRRLSGSDGKPQEGHCLCKIHDIAQLTGCGFKLGGYARCGIPDNAPHVEYHPYPHYNRIEQG